MTSLPPESPDEQPASAAKDSAPPWPDMSKPSRGYQPPPSYGHPGAPVRARGRSGCAVAVLIVVVLALIAALLVYFLR